MARHEIYTRLCMAGVKAETAWDASAELAAEVAATERRVAAGQNDQNPRSCGGFAVCGPTSGDWLWANQLEVVAQLGQLTVAW